MPTTILMSKICPHGMEASVFALLAGFANFGNTMAGYVGAYALTMIGMEDIGKGEEDDFSQAWKVCLFGALSPIICLMLFPILIPSASMVDELQRDGDGSTSDGEGLRLLTNGSDLFCQYRTASTGPISPTKSQ